MNELVGYLSNIERDHTYRVIKVLKETFCSRTEKVLSQNGNMYIRKYFSLDMPGAENEWRLLARLSHPSLPRIHAYYELSGKGVLIEEYIEGVRLSDRISAFGVFSEMKAIELIGKICEACLYLHQQQPAPIIHRDIKPDNIICTTDGGAKLIDFGSAREYKNNSNRDTIYVGTIGYAPPEQFGFGQTDTRADVYSIGMTLLTMLTGKAPSRGQKIRLSNTTISHSIQRIIERATQFDPAKRYGDVSMLLAELNNLVPRKTELPNIKKALLKNPNNIYPKHLNWPAAIKVLIMPVHIMLFLTFAAVVIRDMFTPTGYGKSDDLLRFASDVGIFVFLLFPSYVLGFNLFNLNKRIPFFHQKRLLKKIFVIAAIFITGAFLLSFLGGLHSEAYLLAQNSAGS